MRLVPSALIFFLTPLLLASACQSAPKPQTSTTGAPYEYVILGEGAWTPTPDHIAALQTRLPAYLAQNQNKFNSNKPPIGERTSQYKFQYWGETDRAGQRVVAINALCSPLDGWTTRRILVMDGGDCFFNLKYDPASGKFFDLIVNGEA